MINPYVVYTLFWIGTSIGLIYLWASGKIEITHDSIMALVTMYITMGWAGNLFISCYDEAHWPMYAESASEYYPIYMATCPFGTFTLEGKVTGGMAIFIGSISGTISQEEKYIIKYLVRNELRTKTFNADKMSLIVDGTFELEEVTIWYYRKSFGGSPRLRETATEWKVHIPYLPQLNETLTSKFTTP